MICPACGSYQITTIDSRDVKGNHRRRRHACYDCRFRWSTTEITTKEYKDLMKYKKIIESVSLILNEPKEEAVT